MRCMKDEYSSGLEHSTHLLELQHLIIEVLNNHIRGDEIERTILKRKCRNVSYKLYVHTPMFSHRGQIRINTHDHPSFLDQHFFLFEPPCRQHLLATPKI